MVERRFWVPEVAGSNPVTLILVFGVRLLLSHFGDIVQSVRTSGSQPGGTSSILVIATFIHYGLSYDLKAALALGLCRLCVCPDL